MIPIAELPNIDPKKTEKTRQILDALLIQKIISGYNWYDAVSTVPRVITFSHMHESEDYYAAMFKDMQSLGYSHQRIDASTRSKFATYRWEKDFVFRDANDDFFPDLRIRSLSGEYLDLTKYSGKTLEDVTELKDEKLFGDNKGWELNLEFKSKKRLLELVNLFVQKSSRKSAKHWPGAYDVPVLIIGEQAKAYVSELPDFVEARKIALFENDNEVSFVIHEKLDDMLKHPLYTELSQLGFVEEVCFGNRPFIEAYVDKR